MCGAFSVESTLCLVVLLFLAEPLIVFKLESEIQKDTCFRKISSCHVTLTKVHTPNITY